MQSKGGSSEFGFTLPSPTAIHRRIKSVAAPATPLNSYERWK
jgi:hypothetical protein